MNTTKTTQFTPGPWVVECKKFIATPKAVVIAELNDGLQGEYPESGHINANATLIAAAPAMYEALQALLALIGDEDLPDNGELSGAAICDFARSALAQAEGR